MGGEGGRPSPLQFQLLRFNCPPNSDRFPLRLWRRLIGDRRSTGFVVSAVLVRRPCPPENLLSDIRESFLEMLKLFSAYKYIVITKMFCNGKVEFFYDFIFII